MDAAYWIIVLDDYQLLSVTSPFHVDTQLSLLHFA